MSGEVIPEGIKKVVLVVEGKPMRVLIKLLPTEDVEHVIETLTTKAVG